MKTLQFLLPALLAVACGRPQPAEQVAAQPTAEELTREGEHLVEVLDCHACHSPKIMTDRGPQPDPARFLAGHDQTSVLPQKPEGGSPWVLFNMDGTAVVGPWGTSYSANLTPHETGIGSWTEEQFIRAIRQGKYKGMENSRPLLPPMPWQAYAHLTDHQLKAIFTYLKSIKPVDNLVPAAELAQQG